MPVGPGLARDATALREPSAEGYINADQNYNFADGALYRLYAVHHLQ